jgi:hypothetical protein
MQKGLPNKGGCLLRRVPLLGLPFKILIERFGKVTVNLKCRKLFLDGKEFHCLTKNKAITSCDAECKDMVMSNAWKQFLGNEKSQ